ncbi:MAG: chitobiase/beta-hexosaminidase C-terminal domain-containing protein [Bacteroidales bacterium]|jgi:hypothetical protein|nr:chitobiase/beta-hexosaminidase C-terminal domain-containing protein [Bacteroidales bacterium]
MKKILSFFMMMILFGIINAQTVTVFSENMGNTSVVGNIPIATHTGFQNYGILTFTGDTDVRSTTVSAGYTGASGGNNVFITNQQNRYFTISGINTSGKTDLGLSFGFWKQGNATNPITSSQFIVEVATDYNPTTNTGTFSQLSYPTVSTASAWSLVTIDGGTIPASSTLSIRFKQNQTNQQIRIDDVKLTCAGTVVATPVISPAGGAFTVPKTVSITCATAGADIYYTTNGDAPSASSTLYTSPILLDVNGTYTVKAIAIKAGIDDSEIATTTYTIQIFAAGECDKFEDFEAAAWVGSTYAPRNVTDLDGNLWRVSGVGTMDASDHYFDARAIRLRGNASDTLSLQNRIEMQFDKAGLGTVSFDYASYSNHSGGIINLEYSTNGGTSWINSGSKTVPSWAGGGSNFLKAVYDVNIPGNVRIKITKNSQTTSSSVNIDNLCMTDFNGILATPTFDPPGGNVLTTQIVSIECAIPGVTIRYTTNGTEPTTTSAIYSTPLTISSTTILKAKAFFSTYTPSATATAEYNFPIEVANIAAFKAHNTPTATTYNYKITGNVTFIYQNGRNIYIKDASAGLLVYDNSPATITHQYTNGDVISGGIIGSCLMYNGLFEFIPKVNFAAGTPGATVQPTTLTMSNLLANFSSYESQLVKLDEVQFATGTFGTGNAGNINIFQNTSQMICRNHFATFTGFVTDPDTRYNVTGFVIPFNADRQIAPRDAVNDIKKTEYTISLSASPASGGNPTGGGTYHYNENITVQANPSTGYDFVNWTEGGTVVSTNTNYIFTVTGARSLVANYVLKTYTIAVSANPVAGGTASGGGTYTHNNPVSLTATANTGYHFVNWTESGTPVSTANPYNFTATGNRILVANFVLNSYNIAVSANPGAGGAVGGGGSYNHFSTAIVTATPNEAYNFINWTEGGVQQSTNQNYSFTVTGPRTLVANFLIKTYNITSSAGTGGTITPVGINSANYGTQPEYIIQPGSGYHIQYIFVDGYAINYTIDPESSLPYTYKFDPVYAPHTISVTFAQNCYALNPGNIPGAGATITMSPAGCVQHDHPVTFTITTDCYQISQILVNNTPVTIQTPYAATYTINNVTGKLPLIAVTTEVDQYTITATPTNNPNGAIIPSGMQFVDCGKDKTFTFETEFGYRVKTLLIDNVSVPVPVSNSYMFKNVRTNRTIHIEFEEYPQVIIQFGPSAAQGMGGRVFPTYKPDAVNYIPVDSGTVAYPFSIVPDPGYMIEYVYVDNVININAALTGTYIFQNIHSNHSIFATFKPIMLTITATATGNGILTPNGAVQVQHGANQTFMALPGDGHYLAAIYVDGVYDDAATAAGSYTFNNVTANHTISANFAPNQYIITATHGAYGTITPFGDINVEHGTSQTFYFTPITGYQVAKVLIDGIENPAAAFNGFFTFVNITQGHTIHVTFTIKIFAITTTFSPGGNVYPAGIQYVEYNTHSPIFVFNPDPGYIVKQAIIDGINDPLAVYNGEYRFLNVDANHTIYVVFAKDKYTVTASTTPGGVINPAGEVVIPTGTDKTFFFEPYAGYQLARVIIDGINHPDAVQAGFYTFVDIMNDHSIEAQFEKKLYQIFLPDTNEGAVVVPVGGSSTSVEYGAQFNFVVAPLEGYTQSEFSVRANNIVIQAIGGIYSIYNISIDQYITVDGLELNTYTITAKANMGGIIKPAGIYQVKHGDSKTFEMVPNQEYKVSDVVVNGVSEGAITFYTFHNVKANGTLNAYFKYCEVGIDNNEKGFIRVFCTNNVVTIENKDLVPIKQIEVIDMLGSVLWCGQANGDKTEITLKVAKGIYMIRVTREEGHQTVTKVSIY